MGSLDGESFDESWVVLDAIRLGGPGMLGRS